MGGSFSSKRCDVFLSFRGEDTRYNFTSHLYNALEKNKVKTYIDDKLSKGDDISPVLLKAIRRAKLSVIVFSERYATSSWCLDELVEILRRKDKKGQIVVPIFYGVDPSDVRKQKGSFEISASNFKDGKRKVKKWNEALTKAANMSGWDSRAIRSEAKLIEEIVKDIKHKLKALSDEAALAGVIAANAASNAAFSGGGISSC